MLAPQLRKRLRFLAQKHRSEGKNHLKFGGQHRGRAAAATEAARLARVGGKSRARVVDPDSERARVRLSMAVLRGREALKRRVSMLGNAHAAAQAVMATAADASERAGVQKTLAVAFAQSLRGAGIDARQSNLVTSAVVGLAPRKVASLHSVARKNPNADLLSMFAGARGKHRKSVSWVLGDQRAMDLIVKFVDSYDDTHDGGTCSP